MSFAEVREWRNAALRPQHLKRASLTCVVVGVILVVITQAANFASGEFPASMIWQVPLTFLVPFFVSLTTSTLADRSHKLRGPDPVAESDDRLRKLNEFPDQNPNPVLRITSDGVVEYANPASALVCEAIGAGAGEKVPAEFFERISKIANSGSSDTIEVEGGGCTFALLVIGVFEYSFINLYGTDVTALKVLRKFPDLNPSPVMRMSSDGDLEYANTAGTGVARALGIELGEQFPRDIRDRIRSVQNGQAVEPIQVSGEGRTYSLTPAHTAEFDITNIYGEDITARIAMNKFPDQNPNPVLRITSDGVVEYANPASALVCEAIGAGAGEKVPAEFFERISKIANSGSSDTIEVTSEGRSFALLIIGVFEYSFINLYGTEITDALALGEAHRDNELLLLNILPSTIADRLKSGEGLIADRFDEITVLFADVVDFTSMASRMGAEDVVRLLNDIFTMFDELADEFNLEKIKTIGDAYMVVGGLSGHAETHAERVAEMGVNMLRVLKEHSERTGVEVNVRVGMHSGPVVAGVVGIKKFIYDVWGETVNTASRMESHGVPGRIQVVDSTRARLEDDYEFEERGIVDVKGIGKIQTHLLKGRR